MTPIKRRALFIALSSCLVAAVAGHAEPAAQDAQVGMQVDLSVLDLGKSEALLDELGRANSDFRVELEPSGQPTGVIVTDPSDLRSAFERAISRGRMTIADVEAVEKAGTLADALVHIEDISHVTQTAGPKTAANSIERLYRAELARCSDPACRSAVDARFPNAASVIDRLRRGSQECENASLRYATILQGIDDAGGATITQAIALREAGAVVDTACLVAPWDAVGPEVARVGGGPSAQGALNATALIEVAGEDQPFCGGLFISRTEVVTTLHCFAHQEQYDALKEGRIVVRQMGAGGSAPASVIAWKAKAVTMPPATLVGRRGIPVAEDVIRLSLVGGPAAVPTFKVVPAGGLSDAFVPGYFLSRDTDRRPAGETSTWDASTPEWWKGVRWAKPGSCVVVDRTTDCFRMMCQTTHGYSGSPVFATERDPNGSLRLYGIVKGTEGSVNICRPEPLEFSTLGVSSSSR